MDLMQEIDNHLGWMDAVASMLADPELTQQTLDEIASHDHCALGHWLLSEDAADYHALSAYQTLIEKHDAFHAQAAELLVLLSDTSQAYAEEQVLQGAANFIALSQAVITHLQALAEHPQT